MNCQILRTLYLKANGVIPCEDNRGEWTDLGKVSLDADWSIDAVLKNEQYSKIRAALAAGEMPWPKICSECAMIRPHQPMNDQIAAKHIEKLQIETTLACTLRCPGCSALGQIALREKPYTMKLEVYERLLQSLADEGYHLDFIEYCGQGEPLAHPKFAEFVRIARRIMPKTKHRLVTNGNYNYEEKIEGEFIDEIYVSADGITQELYEQYRVRGDVELAKQFMRDASSPAQKRRPLVVWKYILFNYNDGDDELRSAHQFAVDSNVGMLMFILTATEWQSKRYTPKTYPEILTHAPSARLSMTPDFLREAENDQPLLRASMLPIRRWMPFKRARTMCRPDFMGVYPGLITVIGWAAGLKQTELQEISVFGDGVPLGSPQRGIFRPEVAEYLDQPNDSHAGFALAAKWGGDKPHPSRIDVKLTTKCGRIERPGWEVQNPHPLW